MLPFVANMLWFLACLPEAWAFQRATRDVATAQRGVLLDLLRRNAATTFGRAHGFAAIRSIDDYQARVPLSSYDDYAPWIERIGAGEQGVLTAEPVLLLEPSSGSTAASKLIPSTASLNREFQRAIAPWIVDLFRHDPRLPVGSAYWSISPVARRKQRTPGGVRIGFEDDSEYLGGFQRRLSRAVMAVPPEVRLIDDMETFQYVTLLFLLRNQHLALISVWNPTFLSILLGRLADWWPRLVANIAEGQLTPPASLPPDLQQRLVALNRAAPQRAAQISAAFLAHDDPAAIFPRLWPGLRLLSCWADAHAARYVPALTRRLPQAQLQGKGLMASEGVVTFPLLGQAGAALAIRSHFFEFLPTGGGAIRLAHELELGGCYDVVLTTGGGLYRYRLYDEVEVVGHLHGCPLLRFVGKAAHISDWFGEKLNERHVRRALDTLLARYAMNPDFVMLACDEHDGRYAYTLFIEGDGLSNAALRALLQELEHALHENYHYRYCRDLGQLDPLRLFRIRARGMADYMAACRAQGQRVGDIKPTALHHRGGWSRVFQPADGA